MANQPMAQHIMPQPNQTTPAKSRWVLTHEALETLLAFLHPDPELAGIRYRELRDRLAVYFERHLGGDPDEPADETINRVARRLCEGQEIENIERYALGVARHLLQERFRWTENRRMESLDADALLLDPGPSAYQAMEQAEVETNRSLCMERCLDALSASQRALILEYYSDGGSANAERRGQMAERFGLTPAALYLQVHRIRRRLEECFQSCLNRQ